MNANKTKTVQQPGSMRERIMKYFSFSAIILLLLVLSLTQKNFLGKMNLSNLLRDTAPLLIMSSGMTTVSYTHLDVYKRQVRCHGRQGPDLRLPGPPRQHRRQ